MTSLQRRSEVSEDAPENDLPTKKPSTFLRSFLADHHKKGE